MGESKGGMSEKDGADEQTAQGEERKGVEAECGRKKRMVEEQDIAHNRERSLCISGWRLSSSQAARTGQQPLRGQVVDLTEGHRAESEDTAVREISLGGEHSCC
ncbi:unnamed protein product [Pleuronectes platessa]|uniref:Uncharacterized protein n=1 Tax=Pleuronectes platessa TaxID=8262 RepID=A0A9N7YD27_PLEPL|nr:unnamed protein product [Pleuronectes platessa]